MARRIDRPEPGYFRRRYVSGGPWVAARIVRLCACTPVGGDAEAEHDHTAACDRHPTLAALIGTRPATPDPLAVLEVWGWQPTTREDYEHLVAVARWAEAHDPAAPEASPHRRVRVADLPPSF